MIAYDFFVAPFIEFAFMRRALAGALALAQGAGPIGVFQMLRRKSLVGDAKAHANQPGADEIEHRNRKTAVDLRDLRQIGDVSRAQA